MRLTSFSTCLCAGFGSALLFASACSPFSTEPKPGPDKQAVGTWYGAASGAGAGAIAGFQTGSAAAAPGAAIGAGFGAIFGMFSGMGADLQEEDQLRRADELKQIRDQTWAQGVLAEHYARRMELYPGRDIFPADLFFEGDGARLKPGADILMGTIAQMSQDRMPWSRMVVAVYSTARDQNSTYAEYITKKRAEVIAMHFVQNGIEPHRLMTQATTTTEPILIDPDDAAGRYRQAIEFIALDY